MRLIRVINKNWTKVRRMVHKNEDEYVLPRKTELREHFGKNVYPRNHGP